MLPIQRLETVELYKGSSVESENQLIIHDHEIGGVA